MQNVQMYFTSFLLLCIVHSKVSGDTYFSQTQLLALLCVILYSQKVVVDHGSWRGVLEVFANLLHHECHCFLLLLTFVPSYLLLGLCTHSFHPQCHCLLLTFMPSNLLLELFAHPLHPVCQCCLLLLAFVFRNLFLELSPYPLHPECHCCLFVLALLSHNILLGALCTSSSSWVQLSPNSVIIPTL